MTLLYLCRKVKLMLEMLEFYFIMILTTDHNFLKSPMDIFYWDSSTVKCHYRILWSCNGSFIASVFLMPFFLFHQESCSWQMDGWRRASSVSLKPAVFSQIHTRYCCKGAVWQSFEASERKPKACMMRLWPSIPLEKTYWCTWWVRVNSWDAVREGQAITWCYWTAGGSGETPIPFNLKVVSNVVAPIPNPALWVVGTRQFVYVSGSFYGQ